jgi:uncharacterized protein
MDTFQTHLDLRNLDLRGAEHAERTFRVDLEPILLGGQIYQVVPKDGGIALRVDRATGGFLVRVKVAATVYGACMRCLKEVVLEEEGEEQEFAPTTRENWSDADLSPFIDDLVVDVPGFAREALVLGLPEKIHCTDACAGLCPQCGQDLNVVSCDCEAPALDPRLAKLREFKQEG